MKKSVNNKTLIANTFLGNTSLKENSSFLTKFTYFATFLLIFSSLSNLANAQSINTPVENVENLGDLPPQQLQEEMEHLIEEFDYLDISPQPKPAPNPPGAAKKPTVKPSPAKSDSIYILVNRKTHKVHLTVTKKNGELIKKIYNTSTGAPGRETPVGKYKVTGMIWNARSVTYNNAPMDWAVFFKGPFLYAIHGTSKSAYQYLGKANVSKGCVRLTYESAKEVYEIVKQYGAQNTTIEVI